MARGKRKAPELSPDARAANKAGETRREKEKKARAKNAEKQKRFRESMKAAGYKRITLYDDPALSGQPGRMASRGYKQVPAWEIPPTEKSRAAKIRLAVRIRETSLNAGARSPQVRKALKAAAGEFLHAMGEAPEKNALYNDFLALIMPMGDPWGE